jgi:hypothetical protein
MKRSNIVLSILVVLLISCNPCEEVDCPNPFTEKEHSWLPYNENDSLLFLTTNSEETLLFIIESVKSEQLKPHDNTSPYCQVACLYRLYNYKRGFFENGQNTGFGFTLEKTIIKTNLTSDGPNYRFNLSEATILDSILINGLYIKDVYKYKCKPEQDEVAETYMHQGMGLVKIVFRNGQEYELVEHRKAK